MRLYSHHDTLPYIPPSWWDWFQACTTPLCPWIDDPCVIDIPLLDPLFSYKIYLDSQTIDDCVLAKKDYFKFKAVHGAHTLSIDSKLDLDREADAHYFVCLKSDLPNLFLGKKGLGLFTADCLAILCTFNYGEVVAGAAIHGGWRGYTLGIFQNTLEGIEKELEKNYGITKALFRSNVHLTIGPAIFGISYPCGQDVVNALQQHKDYIFTGKANEALKLIYDQCCYAKGLTEEGKCHPDLQLLCAVDAFLWGISSTNITIVRENTFGHKNFYSYRSACLLGTDKTKRQWHALDVILI